VNAVRLLRHSQSLLARISQQHRYPIIRKILNFNNFNMFEMCIAHNNLTLIGCKAATNHISIGDPAYNFVGKILAVLPNTTQYANINPGPLILIEHKGHDLLGTHLGQGPLKLAATLDPQPQQPHKLLRYRHKVLLLLIQHNEAGVVLGLAFEEADHLDAVLETGQDPDGEVYSAAVSAMAHQVFYGLLVQIRHVAVPDVLLCPRTVQLLEWARQVQVDLVAQEVLFRNPHQPLEALVAPNESVVFYDHERLDVDLALPMGFGTGIQYKLLENHVAEFHDVES
jgi:hypothetical protein